MFFIRVLTRPIHRLLFVGFLSSSLLSNPAEATPPPGFEQVDQEVKITTTAGTMAYDIGAFTVKPGSRVKLTLVNADGMQHNLVICTPGDGVTARVGQAAVALGPEAAAKQYVPEMPEVLFHTRVINPGETDTIYFKAPEIEGGYPFVCTLPGHWFSMKGVMEVSSESPGYLREMTFSYFAGRFESVVEMDREKRLKTGPVPDAEFAIEEFGPEVGEPFGLIFDGKIRIPADGEYTFWVSSDDGVSLKIGDEVVVIDDGQHGAREVSGKVDLKKGLHPVELRYFDGGGGRELQVSFNGPDVGRTFLSPLAPGAAGPESFLAVKDEPRVVRVLMPDASTRSIAVGLPDGISYCFDAEDGSVRYGWRGGFLDIRPHMSGRGGQISNLLGERFEVGHVSFPLRIGSNDEPEVKFAGYHRAAPTFFYTIDGVEVTQTVGPAPQFSGLVYTFQLKGLRDAPVRFLVEPENLLLSSSAGEWDEGVLTVPAAEAKNFSVTIQSATVGVADGEGTGSHHGHQH